MKTLLAFSPYVHQDVIKPGEIRIDTGQCVATGSTLCLFLFLQVRTRWPEDAGKAL